MQTKRLILNFPNVCKNKDIFGSEKLNLLSGYLFTCGSLKVSWKWVAAGTCCIALLFCTQSTHTLTSTLLWEPGYKKSPPHKPEFRAQNKTECRYHPSPLQLRIWRAEIRSRCVFILQKESPTKKVFQDPTKFPKFIFLMEELSRKSATVDISSVGMEDSGMAELPRNVAHHLPMLPQRSFLDVHGEALPPPPSIYKDELCLPPCGQKNPRNAEFGKGFSFPQQRGIITTESGAFHNSQSSCFLWDPTSYSNTLVLGRMPEDAHRRYEPSQTSPHFCFQCKLIQHIHHRKQLLKNCPHKSLQFIHNSSLRKKSTQPTLWDQCM